MNAWMKNLTKEGSVEFGNGKKPEQLIRQIFEMTTKPGDWVLDSFLGSGTTAAVATKMANLSYHGQEGNIELGTLVDSKKIARQVDDVFTHLIFNKIVQEI